MVKKIKLYTRKYVTGHKIWWFEYYDETRKRIRKSTGCFKKFEAEQVIEQFFKQKEKKLKDSSEKSITLREYAKNFFVWGKCMWILRQHEKDKPFSKAMAKMRRAQLEKHWFVEFGDTQLSDIDPVEVEDSLVCMDASPQTKNHYLYTLTIVMKEAFRQKIKTGLITNPVKTVESFSRKKYEKTEMLTLEELKVLFPSNHEKMLGQWGSFYWAMLFFLKLTTGMRSGELRVLTWDKIDFVDNIIYLEQAISIEEEIGGLKSGYEKGTYIPEITANMLKNWKMESPFPEPNSYVFFGDDGQTVMPRGRMGKKLTKILLKHKKSSLYKKITPKSFRTTYNTYMRRILPEELLRLQLGHRSVAMTERYDRAQIKEKLVAFQEKTKDLNDFWGYKE